MHIAHVAIENFRGIQALSWAPANGVNCLIGPGDSTKTTILDAIELALNPRSYQFADDSDFYEMDFDQKIRITVSLIGLPTEFKADDAYGLHLRGWDATVKKIADEPGPGLEEALSLRLTIDGSLESRWSIFNERIGDDNDEPPALRYKHAKLLATTRLGPYADRHLGWGRQSILTRFGTGDGALTTQLADASRAARAAFRQVGHDAFSQATKRAESLSKHFAVPIRKAYAAELDVQGVTISSGGIALHDDELPLRRLGTGSARLVVSALQYDVGKQVAYRTR